MMKLERPTEVPACIRGQEESLGTEFNNRRLAKPNAVFSWGKHEGTARNLLLLKELRLMSEEHCSFCDGFPFDMMSDETIEHFRPKALFPQLAYTWSNLFLACYSCQKAKGTHFDELLLKPDGVDYSFSRYFMVDYESGEIKPNLTASDADQLRAQVTIDMYKLDSKGKRKVRKREIDRIDIERKKNPTLSKEFISDLACRYLAFDLP